MKLREFYKNNIDRDIQGVIKVDSVDYLEKELSEYVVTKELNKHFTTFYDSFLKSIDNPTDKMGVWISGFFGSGKSHFLKILAYLLQNNDIPLETGGTKKAVDFFDDKISDPMLLANIKKVGKYNNECILFNIDTKADTGGDKNKILQVFEKVLNEEQGLSNIPHIAEFERYLIKLNKYDEFKDNFKKIAGESWKELRSDYIFHSDEIVEAYSKTLGKSKEEAEKFIDTSKEEYSLSIEKFAKRVLDYVKTKDKNYHLIFLVDEVGQYIGHDSKLMLNLQSVVEELGTQCQGKVWVVVTSQEAIDDVVEIKGNDFSKIQGRFDTRLSMSSSDIREVIEKRILEKTDVASSSLMEKYKQDGDIIKNLLCFKNDSAIKLYNSEVDFAKDYPFVPYQYEMLQQVFEGIRKKGYAGKHLSSGERSLLGAFKQVAESNGDKELGFLVPFYEFFDTIDKFLEHQITIVFNHAKSIADDNPEALKDFDINVLKVLFLLKNIDYVEANADNITTFCVDNISNDKTDLRKKVEESLKRLERQTLIQRTNDFYTFLTDDEQEINREIKNVQIDLSQKSRFFRDEIFASLYPDPRYMLNKFKPFPLKKSIDGVPFTNEYDIGIEFITSYSDKSIDDIKRESDIHQNMLYVYVPVTDRVDSDIENVLKIDSYSSSKANTLKNEKIELILKNKKDDSSKVRKNIKEIFIDTLSAVDVFIAGEKVVVNGNTFKARIDEGLNKLVNNVYRKISYIETNHVTKDIQDLFYNKNYEGTITNKLAYNEINDFIDEKTNSSTIYTIRQVLQRFGGVPYGFSDEEILYILVMLLKNDQISLYISGENLSKDDDQTYLKLTKRDYYDKVTVKTRKKISDNLINDLRYVARKAFNNTSLSQEEDKMIAEFKDECINKELNTLKLLQTNYHTDAIYKYPGENDIKSAYDLLTSLKNINDNTVLFDEVSSEKDEIVNNIEKISDIKNFFGEDNNGKQKEFFDNAVRTLKIYDNNSAYMKDSDEILATANQISTILKSDYPYKNLPTVNLLTKDLINQLGKKYNEICEPAVNEINENIKFIEKYSKDEKVSDAIKDKYINILKDAIALLDKSNECKDIFAKKSLAEEAIKNFIEEAKKEKEPNIKVDTSIKRKVVRLDAYVVRDVNIDKKEDIDSFVDDIKSKLYKELEDNKNIVIK